MRWAFDVRLHFCCKVKYIPSLYCSIPLQMALKLQSVNAKVVRKLITYPVISKLLSFVLNFFLILISFSNGLFLQLERIRNSNRLCGQICNFIKNVGINAKFTQTSSAETYQYLTTIGKHTISSLNSCKNESKSLRNSQVMTVCLTLCFHGANLHHRHSKS